MKMNRNMLRLYGVTEQSALKGLPLLEAVENALRGGLTCLQLREKNLNRDALLLEASQLNALCGRYGVPLIINDHLDVAIESGAAGVHLGQSDMEISKARQIAGAGLILGATAKTVEQARRAEQAGADYLGVGALFPSPTKPDAIRITMETLGEIAQSVSIPVCAIGGITEENLYKLSNTGIAGPAMVSGIFGSEDIEAACKRLRTLCKTLFESNVILVNGEEVTLDGPLTIKEFLTKNGYRPNRIALEYNGELLSKEKFSETSLCPSDTLTIVQFMGGG